MRESKKHAASYKRVGLHLGIILSFFLLAPSVNAEIHTTSIRLEPSTGTVHEGSIIPVALYISSPGLPINAASAVISFPPDKFEAVSVSAEDSIFSFWVERPHIDNSAGTIRFGGIAFDSGFSGENGNIMTIRFRARSEGQAYVGFLSNLVLAADGRGSEVSIDTSPAIFTISRTLIASTGATTTAVSWNSIRSSESFIDFTFAEFVVFLIATSALVLAIIAFLRKRKGYGRDIMSSRESVVLENLKEDIDEAEDILNKRMHNKDK